MDGGDMKAAITKAEIDVSSPNPPVAEGCDVTVPSPTCNCVMKREHCEDSQSVTSKMLESSNRAGPSSLASTACSRGRRYPRAQDGMSGTRPFCWLNPTGWHIEMLAAAGLAFVRRLLLGVRGVGFEPTKAYASGS